MANGKDIGIGLTGFGEGGLDPAHLTEHIEQPRIFGLRRSALLEIVLFFGLFLLMDMLFLDGMRLRDTAPHPFWIAVILISIQYGVNEGLVAAVVAAAVLLFRNIPPQGLSQDMYAYVFQICAKPIMWIPSALILGSLRTRQIRDREALRKTLAQSRRESNALALACQRLTKITSQMETRIASKFCTVFTVFKAAKLFTHTDEAKVLDGVKDAVESIMGPQRFSLFTVLPNGLQAVVRVGWDGQHPMKHWFDPGTDLFQQVVREGEVLCVADPHGETILEDQGLLAGPITDPVTDEVLGMLKIEDMKFLDLNEETVDLFKILCDWIGMALAQARSFASAIGERFQSAHPRLISEVALDHQIEYFGHLGRRLDLDVAMILINPLETQVLDDSDRALLIDAFAHAVEQSLRQTDVAFECRRRGPHFVVILVGAPQEQAQVVCDKLSTAFADHLPEHLRGVRIKYHVKRVETDHE